MRQFELKAVRNPVSETLDHDSPNMANKTWARLLLSMAKGYKIFLEEISTVPKDHPYSLAGFIALFDNTLRSILLLGHCQLKKFKVFGIVRSKYHCMFKMNFILFPCDVLKLDWLQFFVHCCTK